MLADGAADVGNGEAAEGRAAGWIKGLQGLDQAEAARLLQVLHGHGGALAFAPGQFLHQRQVAQGELVALLVAAFEGIGRQGSLVLAAHGAEWARNLPGGCHGHLGSGSKGSAIPPPSCFLPLGDCPSPTWGRPAKHPNSPDRRPIAESFHQPGGQATGVATDTGSRPAHCNRAGHWRRRP